MAEIIIGESADPQHRYAKIDSLRPMAVEGKTGTGKSTVMEIQAIWLIKEGFGILSVDPHGPSAKAEASNIPPEYLLTTVYFNPLGEKVIHLNPFQGKDINREYDGVRKLFEALWGMDLRETPRLSEGLRAAIYGLYEYQGAFTFHDLNEFFTDHSKRDDVYGKVFNPIVLRYLEKLDNRDGEGWDKKLRAEALAAIQNKLLIFLDPILKPILCQYEDNGDVVPTFDFRRAMDKGHSIICNLNKGRIGAERAAILATILVHLVSMAAVSRGADDEDELGDFREFYMFLDEFSSYANWVDTSFAFQEARKYKVIPVIGLQTFRKLDEAQLANIFGNVSTYVCFRISGQDAEVFAPEFGKSILGEKFEACALVDLPDYNFYLKTVLDHLPTEPRKYHTREEDVLRFNPEAFKKLVKASNARYGRFRVVTEDGNTRRT